MELDKKQLTICCNLLKNKNKFVKKWLMKCNKDCKNI